MIRNVQRGSGALVRVGEADLEDVVLVFNNGNGGSGGGQEEHAVSVSLSAGGFAGLGGGGSQNHLGTGVQRGVVGVDNLFHVVLVIFVNQFNLEFAALGVDFIHGDFSTVLGGQAVQGRGAGGRTAMGNLQGDGLLGESGADSQRQHKGEDHSDKLFHLEFLL